MKSGQNGIDASKYSEVIDALKHAGHYSQLRKFDKYGYQLICVSGQDEEGYPQGVSFWLSFSAKRNRWFIIPRGDGSCYLVPPTFRPESVCIDIFRQMDHCMKIPNAIVEQYSLERVSTKELQGFEFID